MTIEQLIAAGEWMEKIVTEKGEILDSMTEFPEAKKEFLEGSKNTRNWVLVACANKWQRGRVA